MSSQRLASGGLIDRTRAISFSFDGQKYAGHPGDTLASALLANNQWLLGRSFKYHRPRGVLSAGAAEPNALVTSGLGARSEPNVRATMLELHEGLTARSQNNWPSLRHDVGAVNGLFGPVMRAGFYYKTFMWPAAFWEKVYEPLIRRAAGLGSATTLPDPDHYEKTWAHCDLLVVGAGPAGLAAALSAARAGARVILVDEQHQAGGSAAGQPDEPAAASQTDAGQTHGAQASIGQHWIDNTLAELKSLSNVQILLRTTVFGWYDSGVFGALESVQKHLALPQAQQPIERLWRIIAKSAVMATGTQERPLVFNGNDRPGILLASALRTYVNRYAVRAGQSVAVITNNDSGYACATDLLAAGVNVTTLIDRRANASAMAEKLPFRVISSAQVIATTGRHRLKTVTVESPSGREQLDIDTLGMSGGYSPVIHLSCQRGAKPIWDNPRQLFAAPLDRDGLYACGGAAGLETMADCIAHGIHMASECLSKLGFKTVSASAEPNPLETKPAPDTPSPPPSWQVAGDPDKAFVDFQNDVTAADLDQAVREGYGHVEMAKRYTTTGMATDQGKTGNINAIGLLAQARQVSPAEIGTTTFRPFYTPVSFGALAGVSRGEHFQPRRRSPLHVWAQELGARFVEVGHWDRSAYFPRAGESHWRESVDREVLAVRHAVGICDVSTLGKIELFGADCAEFLNRVYCNKFLKLPIGKARYGLMLREDGFIFDDGTTSRLTENHYVMTTTTGAAGAVMTHLEWCLQVLWPELDVRFASVSDQWAQMAVAGPKSRQVLQKIIATDISEAACPFLAARSVTLVNGLTARLFRISFSGELAYELAVPADHGSQVAQWLMAQGQAEGITAYGSEALSVLRIEKGFVTHAEIDGRVTPDDLGMGQLAGTDKPYVGQALLRRPALMAQDRAQLVGLKPVDGLATLRAGAHLLNQGSNPSMANDQGHVSSACHSPTLGYPIALALLRNGRARHGETILVWDALRNSEVPAVVTAPVMLTNPATDPEAAAEVVPALPNPSNQTDPVDELPSFARQSVVRAWFEQQVALAPAIDSAQATTPVTITEAAPDRIQLLLRLFNANTSQLFNPAPAARMFAPGQMLWIGGQALDLSTDEPACVDQSHSRCRLRVTGSAATQLLAKGTGIDLHASQFAVGDSTATLLGHISVVLTRLQTNDFEIIVSRSYALHLAEMLSIWGEQYSPVYAIQG